MVNWLKKNKILFVIFLLGFALRFYGLSKVPVSLFGDELEVGYQAYSILKTGRDYYGNFMPLHFHSLAEYRTPLYLYSCVPTVALFGISPLGVRLPAAIFGFLTLPIFYFLTKKISDNKRLALIATLVMSISPWHIQYSRAAFEVTQLIFFLLLGLYLFLISLENKGRYLWMSVVSFILMPWIYSTAKFFTPFFMGFIFLLWQKQILKFPRKQLIYAMIAGLVIGLPVVYSTIFGGGAERFSYISVFTDPTTETEIGAKRDIDNLYRGELQPGASPHLFDRLMHNKYGFWGNKVINNYFGAFSTQFFFTQGDPNLRHSINGVGGLHKIEIIPLLLGIIFFFSSFQDKKTKWLILLWILLAPIPASITRDGGAHATRLILLMPPILFLVAYGINWIYNLKTFKKYLLLSGYFILLLVNFIYYQHHFWVHNPYESERWWHSGFEDSIKTVKQIQGNYDKVIISTASEPPWVFFAAWYEYPPRQWQENFPIDNVVNIEWLGDVSHIDKFYFGSLEGGLYDWGKEIDNKTLYMATQSEVSLNLIMEPDRLPADLKLIKAVAYPSGEPAYYLLSGNNEN